MASTTTVLPPGSRTIRSGRSRPSSDSTAGLLLEVAVVEHAGHLHHPAELDLAPAAAHLRRPERLDQVAGLGLKRLLGPGHRLHLLDQSGVGRDALLLHLVELAVHPRQRVVDRADQVVHRLLTLLEVRRGRLLELAQLGLGQLEEGLVVLPQRFGRERGEGVACDAGEGDEPNDQATGGGSKDDAQQEHGDVHEISGEAGGGAGR